MTLACLVYRATLPIKRGRSGPFALPDQRGAVTGLTDLIVFHDSTIYYNTAYYDI